MNRGPTRRMAHSIGNSRRRSERFNGLVVRILLVLLLLCAAVAVPVVRAPSAHASTAGSAIVAAARGQAGYKATPEGSNCNKFSAYWGSGVNDCGNSNRDAAWCADFAAWAWAQAGITGLYGNGINAMASSFRTWGQSTGRWHPLGDGYAPQPGDVAEYSDHHVGIYTGGPANSPTVISGNWWYPDRATGQVHEQADVTDNGARAPLSGYVGAPDSGSGGGPPPPDTDSDGTPDSADRCPNIPGPPNSAGCPSRPTGILERSDDTIDVFARASNNHLTHRWLTPNGWQPAGAWEDLAGSLGSAPVALQRTGGIIDVFARGTNNHLIHRWLVIGSGWQPTGGWEDLGGKLGSTPALLQRADGTIDVFARGANGHLIHRWLTGSGWQPASGWEDLGGSLASAPSVEQRSEGIIDVFARGTDGHLTHRWLVIGSGWQPANEWEDLGGSLGSAPVVVQRAGGILDVFARSSGATLTHRWLTDGGWQPASGWEDLGGTLHSTPSVTQRADGTLDVFAQGSGGHLTHRWLVGNGWQPANGWEDLSGSLRGSPVSVQRHGGILDVFSQSGGSTLTHRWLVGNGWQPANGWEDLSGTLATPSLGPQAAAPNMRITGRPQTITTSRTATFTFSNTSRVDAAPSETCALDRARFKPCRSDATYRSMNLGRHTFRVRAADYLGRTSPTATFTWTIKT